MVTEYSGVWAYIPKREDLTLQLWLDMIREDRGLAPATEDQKTS